MLDKLLKIIPRSVIVSTTVTLILFLNLIVCRIVLFLTPSPNYSVLPLSDWPLGFLVGLRFDLSASFMGGLLVFLFVFIAAFYKDNLRRISKSVLYVIYFLFFFIFITDWITYEWISFRIDSRMFPYFIEPSLIRGGASDTPIPFFTVILFLAMFFVLNYGLLKAFNPTFNLRKKVVTFKQALIYIPTTLVFLFIAICSVRGFDTIPLKANDYLFHKRNHLNIVSRNFFFHFASEVALYIKLSHGSKYVGALPDPEVKRLREFLGFNPKPISRNPLEHKLNRCVKNKFLIKNATIEKPNIVLLLVESLGYNPYKKTRFLKELGRKGILFDHFLSNGTMTFDGVWSSLCSVMPTFGRLQTALLGNNFQCIPDVLKKRGYENSFFYAGDLNMDNLKTFANKHSFDNILGKKSFPKKDMKLSRFFDDDTFFNKVADFHEKKKGPFFTVILNVQTHPPSEIPKDFVWPKDVPDKSLFTYFDLSLKNFFDRVKDSDYFDNTIFIITGDHTQHNQSYNPTDDRKLGTTLWEFRTPLIVYAPKLIKSGEVVNDLGAQVDLPATVFDILNLNINSKGWGSSMFCKNEFPGPAITFSRRLSYMSILKEGEIYSTFYKGFKHNKLLSYDKKDMFSMPLQNVTKPGDERKVKEFSEFIYHVNRNIISNNYYWE